MKCIIGYMHPRKGSVKVDGISLDELGSKVRVRSIAYVPQLLGSSYSYTLRDYVVMGRTPHLSIFRQPGSEDYEMADSALDEVGLYRQRYQPFNSLSGGEQRQAAIIRAIIQNPKLIVMDEPTNHLDYGNQYRIIKRINMLAEKGISVIITSHMPDHVMRLGGRVGVIQSGTMVVGDVGDIINNERMSKLYGFGVHVVYVKEVNRTVCVAGNFFNKE